MAGLIKGWLGSITGMSIGGLGAPVPPANPAQPQFTHPAQNIGMQGATAAQTQMMRASVAARQQMAAAAKAFSAQSLQQFNQPMFGAVASALGVDKVPMPEPVGFTPLPLERKGKIAMRIPAGKVDRELAHIMAKHLAGMDVALCTLSAMVQDNMQMDARMYRMRVGAKVALPLFNTRHVADLRYVTSMFKVPCQLAVLLMIPRDKLAGMFSSALREPLPRNIIAVLDSCSNELVWQANDQILTHGWTYGPDDKLYAPVVYDFAGDVGRGLLTDNEMYDRIASDASAKLYTLVHGGKAYTKDHPMEWHAAKLEELMK